MPREHDYFVYIVASRSRTLYIGVTNGLVRRVEEHRSGAHEGFTKKYRIHRLVYFERFAYIDNAIAREKELKLWTRDKKLALISEFNPTWEDLFLEFGTSAEFRAITGKKQVLRFAQDDNVSMSES